MADHVHLDIGPDRIAVLSLDHQGKSTNVLSMELVSALEVIVGRLAAMKEVRGVLIRSAKPKQFIAGADIDEIRAITDPNEASDKARIGQHLMSAIESLPFPTVAVIDGPCLGGGMELALACTYRVAGDGAHVRMALPEVRLGIVPGFGGTQRMPKVVGLLKALDLIVSGRTLRPQQAYKLGLVDDVAPSPILEEVAKTFISHGKYPKRPSREPVPVTAMMKLPPARKFIFGQARKKTLKETSGFYPAPLAAIEVIEETFAGKSFDGYEVEARKVGELIASPISKSLISIFQATEEIRRTKHDTEPKPVHKVGIVGAGVMGGGIAHLAASKDKTVRFRDIGTSPLAKGMGTLFELTRKEVKKRRIDPREAHARISRVAPTTDWSGFGRADFVIEAVVEKMDVKKQVFTELSKHVRPDAVLATNTSALSITEIATAASHPDRVVGLHFFNPVDKMPLVEIIRGAQTSVQTVSTTWALALELGKTPIVVADRPGFLVNRILGLYLNEACRLVEDSVPLASIDQAMKAFGMPMGPFELMDEVGLDVAEKVGVYLTESLSHFPKASRILERLVEMGRLGRKNGKGFYIHEGKKRTLDATLAKMLTIGTPNAMSYEDIVDRLVLLQVNEASRCLEEGVTASSRDVDIGMVLGTGFAPFRGGLLAYADTRGPVNIVERLSMLDDAGNHYKPSALLLACAREKQRFRT